MLNHDFDLLVPVGEGSVSINKNLKLGSLAG